MYGIAALIPLNKLIAASTLLLFFAGKDKKHFYLDRIAGV